MAKPNQFTRTRRGSRQRSPRPKVGPNEGRLGCVEWMPIPEDDRRLAVRRQWEDPLERMLAPSAKTAQDEQEFPLLLRRDEKAIAKARHELFEKVWWNRHQMRVAEIESGTKRLTDEEKSLFERAQKAARRIERKYGRKNLVFDDFEWGLVCGRYLALGWMLGQEWEGSLGT